MKHWQELGQILDRVLHLARTGQTTALATVTRIRGSAYRRPGARLLVARDGSTLGGVSGGCLEEDVREVGLQAIRTGTSRVRHYETGSDETKVWGLGLGCDGEVDVAVQPIPPAAALGVWAGVRERLEGAAPFAVAIRVAEGTGGEVLVADEPSRLAGEGLFVEVLQPPPTLLVCGAGDDAGPLVAAAANVGFRVVVADHRPAYAKEERFPQARRVLLVRAEDEASELPVDARTYAVVMTHSLARDAEWLRRLAVTEVPYLGILGPRARAERLAAELPRGVRERVFGPVGLDLGAEGPEQVALSILAEVLATASGREPRHLRERAVPVHA